MSSHRLLRRISDRMIGWCGDDSRVDELSTHLHDAELAGHPLSHMDVASIIGLAASSTLRRTARDLPFWLAGLPVALMLFIPLAISYETHFFAWDMIERTPENSAARFWKTAVNIMLIAALATGIVVGRRCVQHLRRGQLALPATLFGALVVAVAQLDLFVERTPWWRDGRLLDSHINEVPAYSVALFATFAAIPVLFLIVDFATSRSTRSGPVHELPLSGPLNPKAIAAVTLPVAQLFAPLFWVLPFLVLVWLAEPFSRRLQVLTTVSVALPLVGFVMWGQLVGPIDDGTVALLATVLAFASVWLRLAFVALAPIRTARDSPQLSCPDTCHSEPC